MNSTGIARITQRFLNDVNDPVPGQSVSTGESFAGQVGAVITLNADAALALSDTAVGTLYGGRYQYVKFYGSQSGTTVAKGPVYWQDADNFVVTADVPTNGAGFAGVALNVVTKGNYGWILVEGKASLSVGVLTKGTPAIGDPVSTSTIGIFDDVDTTPTALIIARYVGVWGAAPSNNNATLGYVRAIKNAN